MKRSKRSVEIYELNPDRHQHKEPPLYKVVFFTYDLPEAGEPLVVGKIVAYVSAIAANIGELTTNWILHGKLPH